MKTQLNPTKLTLKKTVVTELLQDGDGFLAAPKKIGNEPQPTTGEDLTVKSCVGCITIGPPGLCDSYYAL